MAKRLTPEQMEARYEALSEAAEHLRGDWTENPVESEQSGYTAAWLDMQAARWLQRAIVAKEHRADCA